MTRDSRRAAVGSLAAATVVATVAFAVYLPALGNGFAADDFFILARTKALSGLAHPLAYFQFGFFDYYRPIPFLTHALDWDIWGPNAFGFHLVNVLIHAANTVLVFLIGRRLLAVFPAMIAALLFAVHPASHEAVYWIAARFDLLATFFTLAAVWCLTGADNRWGWRLAGALAFACGLLSKESAVSLLLIVPAWDVFVAKRDLETVVRRLAPLLVVAAGYAALRHFGADLDTTGGARRLSKLVMAGALMATIVSLAPRHERDAPATSRLSPLPWWTAAVVTAMLGGLLWGPAALAPSVRRVLGSVAYAAFYLTSPVVFPSPRPAWFSPESWHDALAGLLVVALVLGLITLFSRFLVRHAETLFLCLFVVAALIPVSSMVGGLRYLYLASAGVSLFAAWWLSRIPRGARRLLAAAIVTVLIAVSLTQVLLAGRVWRGGADVTRDGIALMAATLQPCGTKDVILLTTPVGIGGVYSNFYFESFDILAGCSPRSLRTLLRLVGEDAHVDVLHLTPNVIELRVPRYRGNIMASEDLSNFTVTVTPGLVRTIETTMGRLEIFAEGSTQVFRITLTDRARDAQEFYYSDGAVRRAGD